ncbi:VanW family protein [Peptoniphilus sp. oral taxon 386]|uniref:VanW family protein n=1 Tax=Peptoniphilus sp. oral taxon 386 TaxID=652713 RepID=UPI0001DAA471|nr:VanW family protein [Peptoniphilus sp. oral taxon 386]EFI41354.1 VanW-like protein [Peptoniphilus sp. oral taxon 386 str. F0131]
MHFSNKRVISVVLAVVLLGIAIIYYSNESKSEKIHRGIKISNIDVSELSVEDAILKITSTKEEENKDAKLKFSTEEMNYFIPYKDLGYTLDVETAVKEAYLIGRSNSIIKNFFDIIYTSIVHKNIELSESFSVEKVDATINFLVEKVYKKPKNAEISYSAENGFNLSKEEQGSYLDSKKLKELIFHDIDKKEDIQLPILKSEPTVYIKQFEGIDGLLSEFSTDYSKSEDNRKDNIALGASHFNDFILKSGEEVSFNNVVGDISLLTGFKDAGIIINGEFDRGVGGGICQVSTTLYNALIRADLDIVERYNHTRPISYVPLGTDAAVSQGYKDLKFRNNLNHNIYFKAFADGNELKFQIFGNKADRDYQVEIEPKLLAVTEPNVIIQYSDAIEEGKEEVKKPGAKGYSYVTYKNIIKDGQIVETQKISSSNYIAQDKVVVIGEGDPDVIREKKEREKKNYNKEKTNKKTNND